jgi:hypothetical protein
VTARPIGDGRPSEDRVLRRHVVLTARTSFAAAMVTLAGGLVLGLAGQAHNPAAVATAPVEASTPAAATPTLVSNWLSPSGTATSPVVWRVSRTGDRAKDAALAAYQVYLGTTIRLWEEPDPADPAIPQVALEPELSRLRTALSVSSDAQISRRGRVIAAARLQLLRGSQAIVIGCVNSAEQRLYDGQDRRDPRWRGGLAVSAARMRWDDARWKVYLVAPLPAARCHH